jgi:hypothetical protein
MTNDVTGPAECVDGAISCEVRDNNGANTITNGTEGGAIDSGVGSVSITAVSNTIEIVKAIDQKIAELEQEADELRQFVQRLSVVSAKIEALKQSRAVLADETAEIFPPSNSSGGGNNTNNGVIQGSLAKHTPISRLLPGSIGSIALESMRDAGRPIHVKDILAHVHAKGKPEVTMATLVSTLCTYTTTGKVKRTAPSTYAVGDIPA